MATFLDVGLLKTFSSVFPFLFVLVLMWVVLMRVKYFSANKAFAAFIAFLFAVVALVSPILVKTINLMAPWFVLLFLVIVFVMIVYQAFGIKEDQILGVITGEYSVEFAWTILAVVGMIILGSLFFVLEEEGIELRPGANVTVEDMSLVQWSVSLFSNPKILGFIAIMLIAIFTVQRLLEK